MLFLSPFWGRGFRPFFFFGTLFGGLSVLLWSLVYSGHLAIPTPFPSAIHWHAHEMVFGFGIAIVAGFLLTAVANWTGGAPARNKHLALLCGLWFLGRLAVNIPSALPLWAIGIIDAAFLPALAITLAIPLLKSKNTRNFVFLVLITILLACQVGFYATGSMTAIHVALLVIMAMISLIGGRIIPSFTFAALRQRGILVQQLNQTPYDIAAVASLLIVMAAWIFLGLDSIVMSVVSGLSCIIHTIRLRGFHTRKALIDPMLWILHVGYIWLTIGLGALSLTSLGIIPLSNTLHIFTVGAMGSMILGMVCRVALGHTGRPIKADLIMEMLFFMMQGSVILRVAVPLAFPEATAQLIIAAAVLWGISFTTYAIKFYRILTTERPDGASA